MATSHRAAIVTIVIMLDQILSDKEVQAKALAEKVGVSAVTLSQFSTGKKKQLNISTLDQICRILNCSINDLLAYNDESKAPTPFSYAQPTIDQFPPIARENTIAKD